MKNYDYHRPAEKVLLDSYRKQNRNKNRLLFLAVALTVGVIFSGSCTYRWSDFLYDKLCLWENTGGHPKTYPDRWNDSVNVS